MNPGLEKLQQYPFEKLAALKAGVVPPIDLTAIVMSIGEPRHPAPDFVLDAIKQNLGAGANSGLSSYPLTAGSLELRQAIASWLTKRFDLAGLVDSERHILPVNGTREALFAVAQCFAGKSGAKPQVLMPNPFYQIYEGAALLAGATPTFIKINPDNGLPDFASVKQSDWQNCTLLYICSPGNPTGAVISPELLTDLIDKAIKYDFIIASDECYSELYFDESAPPWGILQAAKQMGNDTFKNCLAFHSLSKRSSLPGMRSGFVAGDSDLITTFKLYRTYHGCAMAPPFQVGSTKAWLDENHVIANRAYYRQKFAVTYNILKQAPNLAEALTIPAGGFYYWLKTPGCDQEFARDLFEASNVTVLPGSFLARSSEDSGTNHGPGYGYVRVALVPTLEDCVAASERIRDFAKDRV